MDPVASSVAALFHALDRHGAALARGDVDRRLELSTEVGGHVAHVAGEVLARQPAPVGGEPPRAVGLAMAQALFAAPHLSRTLSVYTTATEHVLFQPTERLAAALGLPVWQLEEVRNEVDQAVATVLRRIRVLHWLWHRAGNPRIAPDTLWNMLFPGAVGPAATHFSYRGSRLYAVLDQEHPAPPEALYLQWLPGSERWTCVPDTHFASRFLDPGLARTVARAVGARPDEVDDVLDSMICAVPGDDEPAFTLRDRWRSEGWADLTQLGTTVPGTAWLTLPLAADAISPDGWLELTPDGLALKSPQRIFDRQAMTRLSAMMKGIYAEMCARLLAGKGVEAHQQAWIFDLDPYIQRVLQPLLDWAANPKAHRWLAQELGAEVAHVGAAMSQVREGWLKQARTSWGGVPTAARPYTVQGILASHLAVSQASLAELHARKPDPRAAHHRILLLFFAHHMRAASLGRLWRPVDGSVPPPEDVVGQWFWSTWQRVLDAAEETEDD